MTNIYQKLNNLVDYTERHLEGELSPDILAKSLNTNAYTAGKIFSVLAGQSFSEYVRKRRLSLAGQDLCTTNFRVIDIAIKYGYDSPEAFSRAFVKFHGIKPSQVTKTTKLKNYPKLHFNDAGLPAKELDYEIVDLPELSLSGHYIETNNNEISKDAPMFFQVFRERYIDKYGEVDYGMVAYGPEHLESQRYYCLYAKTISGFDHIYIPPAKWLKFTIPSQQPSEIQDMSHKFYRDFLPSSNYRLRELPELEHYHNGITDFLVAVEAGN